VKSSPGPYSSYVGPADVQTLIAVEVAVGRITVLARLTAGEFLSRLVGIVAPIIYL